MLAEWCWGSSHYKLIFSTLHIQIIFMDCMRLSSSSIFSGSYCWFIIHTNSPSFRYSHFHLLCPPPLSSNISPFRHVSTGSLSFIQLLVLSNAPPTGYKTKYGRQSTPGYDDSAAGLVSRLLRSKEEVRRKPVRDGGYTVCYGNQCSSLCSGSRHDGGFPRYLYLNAMVSCGQCSVIREAYIQPYKRSSAE